MARKKQNTPTAPNVGVDYLRYSDQSQKDISIEQQHERCMEYAERNNLTIIESYADRAISGRTDKRPAFQRMMKDAANGKFGFVIAWKSNRMGRNMLQAMINEEKLRSYGVKVYYVEEYFEDNAAGRFAHRSIMNVNQFYSENLSEDVMRGMISNAQHCKVNGPLPLGYRKGEDGKYAINEKTAPLVKEIFERVSKGDQFIDIASDFNARGLRTSKGSLWNKSSFHSITKNEIYMGVYKFADVRIEGGAPEIVSPELFYEVGGYLKGKKNPQGRSHGTADYLLTGKLFCGHCKHPMVGMSGTSKSQDLHYYYSCNGRRVEKICKKENARRDYVEQLVTQLVKDYVLQEEIIEWVVDQGIKFHKNLSENTKLHENKQALVDVQLSIKNILTAIRKGIITSSTKEDLLELEQEKSGLEMLISMEEGKFKALDKNKLLFATKKFCEGDVEDKDYQKRLISTFVSEVFLYDDLVKITFAYDEAGMKISRRIDKKDIDKEPSEVYSVRIEDLMGHQFLKALSSLISKG
jgi:DNA invertase Pin-like site-specific DNA recombinase